MINSIFDEIEGFLKERRYYREPLIRALKLAKQGKRMDVLLICDRLITSKQNDPMPYIVKAMFYKGFDEFDKGLRCLDQIRQYGDLEPFCAYMRADFMFELERFEETVKWAGKAISGGIDLGAYSLKGLALHEIYDETSDKKLLKDILYYYDEALAIDLDSHVLYRRASVLSDLERHDESIECIDEALAIEPGNPTYLLEKALILDVAKRRDESIKCARKVIKLDIKNAGIQYVLAILLCNLNLLDESLHALNTAQKLDPTFQDIDNVRENIEIKRRSR